MQRPVYTLTLFCDRFPSFVTPNDATLFLHSLVNLFLSLDARARVFVFCRRTFPVEFSLLPPIALQNIDTTTFYKYTFNWRA